MLKIPRAYLEVLSQKDFSLLVLVILIGRLATAFLLLSLVVSTFSQTGSSFGVSGVILSVAIPSFLLMAFAGVAADIFDRRKIIIAVNILIILPVIFIVVLKQTVYASIPFSLVYFAGNSFFLPAASAASAQLVARQYLLISNSIFIISLAGGMILGMFLASLVHFFFGSGFTLVICAILLIIAAALSFFLPSLFPSKKKAIPLLRSLGEIWRGFIYVFNNKVVWIFFLIFSLTQGIVAVGLTLAPGFFNDVVNLSINQSPIFILPLIGVGVVIAAVFLHLPNLKEGFLVSAGTGLLGFALIIIGLVIKLKIVSSQYLLWPMAIFLVTAGFAVTLTMIASRARLQKEINHRLQGTVFGANIILSSFLAAIMSPASAAFEVLFGYIDIAIFGGIGLAILATFLFFVDRRWKFRAEFSRF